MTDTLRQRVCPALVGGCLALGLSMSAPARADDLRIGFLSPTTGFLSQTGQDMVHGFQLYLDDHNGMLGGAKVDLIVEDTQGKPDVAVTKAKKLVLQDHVDMFIGGVLASTGYALAPVSTEEKTVYISSIAAADDLTPASAQQISLFHPHHLGELAAKSSAWPMGLRPGLQESRDHRRRLCLRL